MNLVFCAVRSLFQSSLLSQPTKIYFLKRCEQSNIFNDPKRKLEKEEGGKSIQNLGCQTSQSGKQA